MRKGYLDLAFLQLDWVEVGRHRPARQSFDAVEATALAARNRLAELMKDAHDALGPDGNVDTAERATFDEESKTVTLGASAD